MTFGTYGGRYVPETLVPALGFSRKPWDYPASTHAKALASHLVYGAAMDAGFRLIDRTVH